MAPTDTDKQRRGTVDHYPVLMGSPMRASAILGPVGEWVEGLRLPPGDLGLPDGSIPHFALSQSAHLHYAGGGD